MNTGDVVTIRGCQYKIVGFTDEGWLRVVRVDSLERMPGGGVWAVE